MYICAYIYIYIHLQGIALREVPRHNGTLMDQRTGPYVRLMIITQIRFVYSDYRYHSSFSLSFVGGGSIRQDPGGCDIRGTTAIGIRFPAGAGPSLIQTTCLF